MKPERRKPYSSNLLLKVTDCMLASSSEAGKMQNAHPLKKTAAEQEKAALIEQMLQLLQLAIIFQEPRKPKKDKKKKDKNDLKRVGI